MHKTVLHVFFSNFCHIAKYWHPDQNKLSLWFYKLMCYEDFYLAGFLALGPTETRHLDTTDWYLPLGLLFLRLEVGCRSRASMLRVLSVQHLLSLLLRDLFLVHAFLILLLIGLTHRVVYLAKTINGNYMINKMNPVYENAKKYRRNKIHTMCCRERDVDLPTMYCLSLSISLEIRAPWTLGIKIEHRDFVRLTSKVTDAFISFRALQRPPPPPP